MEHAAGASGDVVRYVGIEYDEVRWEPLNPDEYRGALLASASCTSCWSAASAALANVRHVQLKAVTPDDVTDLINHPHGALRLAAIQMLPRLGSSAF